MTKRDGVSLSVDRYCSRGRRSFFSQDFRIVRERYGWKTRAPHERDARCLAMYYIFFIVSVLFATLEMIIYFVFSLLVWNIGRKLFFYRALELCDTHCCVEYNGVSKTIESMSISTFTKTTDDREL